MISSGIPLVPYFIFAGSEIIMNILIIMHFWTVANSVFDAREGKRVFPLVGGAGLLGGIIGGISIQFVVSVIGTTNLFLVWSILLFLTIPIALRIQIVESKPTSNGNEENKDKVSFKENLKSVWQTPLLRTLSYVAIPMIIAVYIVDYLFFKTLNEVFVDADKLSGFLGLISSFYSLIGLILQLFLTQYLLKRFGVGIVNLVHPASMMIGSILLNFRAYFTPTPSQSIFTFRTLSSIFASASDEVVFRSTGNSATQLLYNAVPEEKRGISRAIISGTIEPIGIIIAGLFLMFVVNVLDISEIQLAGILFGTCLIWLTLAFRIKTHYIQALVNNLGSKNQGLQSTALSELSHTTNPKTIAELVRSLSSKNDEVALFALSILQETKFDAQIKLLCNTLIQSSPTVRVKTLSVLTELNIPGTIRLIAPHLKSSDTVFRAAVVRTIAKLGSEAELYILNAYLKDPNANVRAEAIISFLNTPRNSPRYQMGMNSLQSLVRDKSTNSRTMIAYVIGELESSDLMPLLKQLIESSDEEVQISGIQAIGRIYNNELIEQIVELLTNTRLRLHVVEAIVKIGQAANEPLQAQLYDPFVDLELKMQIVYCLGRLGDDSSIKVLLDLLKFTEHSLIFEGETAIALMSIRNKNIKKGNNEVPIETLEQVAHALNALLTKIKKQRIIANYVSELMKVESSLVLSDALTRSISCGENVALDYLEFLADPDTIKIAKRGLKSSDKRARAEALEVLEGSCDQGRILATILEGDLSEIWIYDKLANPDQVFKKILLDNQDPWVYSCTLYSISESKSPKLEQTLIAWQKRQSYSLDTDHMLKTNFLLALSSCSDRNITEDEETDMDKMKLNMKRILFLRSVPLFVDIEGIDLQWISSIIKEKTYEPGETIVKEHDDGDAMFLIETGSVRVVTGDDLQVTLAILEEREYFGEMSLLDEEKRSATVVAHKKSQLLIITRDDFFELLLSRPKISFSLFKTLSQRLRSTLGQLSKA